MLNLFKEVQYIISDQKFLFCCCALLVRSCLQWKIRRVLAFSLHELARVLGSEVTYRDILPVFEEYCTKDIDDVKIGALTHLADFFEVSGFYYDDPLH